MFERITSHGRVHDVHGLSTTSTMPNWDVSRVKNMKDLFTRGGIILLDTEFGDIELEHRASDDYESYV